ncbi:MAG: peptidase domain-containing ABC transporter [Bacteroidota bacterium]
MLKKRFPHYQQLDKMDCGPTCLRMVAAHYGKRYSLQYLRKHSYIDREGVSMRGIVEAAEHIGFRTLALRLPLQASSPEEPGLDEVPLPAIVHWEQNHFVVVYQLSNTHVWVADPALGKKKMSHAEFAKGWIAHGNKGLALLLEPTPDFYTEEGEELKKTNFNFLFQYLRPYRRLLMQLVIGLLLGSILQLLFPFLTKSIVDIGIANLDLSFIQLIIAAQFFLFGGQLAVNIIQSWILLHVGTRINVSLISDFLIKLMRLPIGYFDSKLTGDLLQRIGDHRRIELFLTNSTLSILFSAFNLIIFGIVLAIFKASIFFIFLVATILYIIWVLLFLRKRRQIDNRRFKEQADNQSVLIELIQGMQEIKLQRSERRRRWKWANVQARLFRVNIKSLSLTVTQDTGANSIMQLKDIIITFIAAQAVIEGQLTLGEMLAIQFLIGQMNGPLQQLVGFIRSAQDAKISLERLGEIHEMEEEGQERSMQALLYELGDVTFDGVSFQYNPLSGMVLNDISLTIPKGKVTAIVGGSGSGKTTLLKLLLGFYAPTKGTIRVSGINLQTVRTDFWRDQCGAVMQDGFIFSDSIAQNIAESSDDIDRLQLVKAVRLANIERFIEGLPLGYNTKIGDRGNGLSQGQKQRLLIARVIYKDPAFLFFDEATNALDANNEKVIMENLERFFEGRTVVVVAHRLSTVKNADQIVVLEQGRIVEQGTHVELTEKRGAYYELVKNQLELGG